VAGASEHHKLDAYLLGQDSEPQHWKFVVTLPEGASTDVLSRLQDTGRFGGVPAVACVRVLLRP